MSIQPEIRSILIHMLRASETNAHTILAKSASVVSISRTLKHKSDIRVKQYFLRECVDLHKGTQELFRLFHARKSGEDEIPQHLRIERLLAASSAQAEFAGIEGASCCHIAMKYGLRVLDCIKDARGKLDDSRMYLSELPELPRLRKSFEAFPAGNSNEISRLQVEISREVARATSDLTRMIIETKQSDRKPNKRREKKSEATKLFAKLREMMDDKAATAAVNNELGTDYPAKTLRTYTYRKV
jgi:hypothetical protein